MEQDTSHSDDGAKFKAGMLNSITTVRDINGLLVRPSQQGTTAVTADYQQATVSMVPPTVSHMDVHNLQAISGSVAVQQITPGVQRNMVTGNTAAPLNLHHQPSGSNGNNNNVEKLGLTSLPYSSAATAIAHNQQRTFADTLTLAGGTITISSTSLSKGQVVHAKMYEMNQTVRRGSTKGPHIVKTMDTTSYPRTIISTLPPSSTQQAQRLFAGNADGAVQMNQRLSPSVSNIQMPPSGQRMSPANVQPLSRGRAPTASSGFIQVSADMNQGRAVHQDHHPASVVKSHTADHTRPQDATLNQLKNYLLSPVHSQVNNMNHAASPHPQGFPIPVSHSGTGTSSETVVARTNLPVPQQKSVGGARSKPQAQKAPRKRKSKTAAAKEATKSLNPLAEEDDDDNDFIPVGMVQFSSVQRPVGGLGLALQQQMHAALDQPQRETNESHTELKGYMGTSQQQTTDNRLQLHQKFIQHNPNSLGSAEQNKLQPGGQTQGSVKSDVDRSQQHQLLLQLVQQVQQVQQQKEQLLEQQRQQCLQQQLGQIHTSKAPRNSNIHVQEVSKNQGLVIRHLQQHQGPVTNHHQQQTASVASKDVQDKFIGQQNLQKQFPPSYPTASLSSPSSIPSPSSSSSSFSSSSHVNNQFSNIQLQAPNKTMAQSQLPQYTNIPKLAEQLLQTHYPSNQAQGAFVSQPNVPSGNEEFTSASELKVLQSQATEPFIQAHNAGPNPLMAGPSSSISSDKTQQKVYASSTPGYSPTSSLSIIARSLTPTSGHHSHHPEISRMLCSPVSPRQSGNSPRASVSPRRTESPAPVSVSPSHFVSPRHPAASPHLKGPVFASGNPSPSNKTFGGPLRASPIQSSGSKTLILNRQNSSPRPPLSPWQPISPSLQTAAPISNFGAVQKPRATVGQSSVHSSAGDHHATDQPPSSPRVDLPSRKHAWQLEEPQFNDHGGTSNKMSQQSHYQYQGLMEGRSDAHHSFPGRHEHGPGDVRGFQQGDQSSTSPALSYSNSQASGQQQFRQSHLAGAGQSNINATTEGSNQAWPTQQFVPISSSGTVMKPSVQNASPIWQQMQHQGSLQTHPSPDLTKVMGRISSKPVDIERLAQQHQIESFNVSNQSLHQPSMQQTHPVSGTPLEGDTHMKEQQHALVASSIPNSFPSSTPIVSHTPQQNEKTNPVAPSIFASDTVPTDTLSKDWPSIDYGQTVCPGETQSNPKMSQGSSRQYENETQKLSSKITKHENTDAEKHDTKKTITDVKDSITASLTDSKNSNNTNRDTESDPKNDVKSAEEESVSEVKDKSAEKPHTEKVSELPKREVRQRKPKKPFEQDDTPTRRTNRTTPNQKAHADAAASNKKQTNPVNTQAPNKKNQTSKNLEAETKTPVGNMKTDKKSAAKAQDADYEVSESEEESDPEPDSNEPRRLSRRLQVKKEERQKQKAEAAEAEEGRGGSNTRKSHRIATRVDYKEENSDPPENASPVRSVRSSSRQQQLREEAKAVEEKHKDEVDKKAQPSKDGKLKDVGDTGKGPLTKEEKVKESKPLSKEEMGKESKSFTKEEKGEESKEDKNTEEGGDVSGSDQPGSDVPKVTTRSRNSRKDVPRNAASTASVTKTERETSVSSNKRHTPVTPVQGTAGTKNTTTSVKSEPQAVSSLLERSLRTRNRSKSRSRSPLTAGKQDLYTPVTRRNVGARQVTAPSEDKDSVTRSKRSTSVSEFVDELPRWRKRVRKDESSSTDSRSASKEKLKPDDGEESCESKEVSGDPSATQSSQVSRPGRGRKGKTVDSKNGADTKKGEKEKSLTGTADNKDEVGADSMKEDKPKFDEKEMGNCDQKAKVGEEKNEKKANVDVEKTEEMTVETASNEQSSIAQTKDVFPAASTSTNEQQTKPDKSAGVASTASQNLASQNMVHDKESVESEKNAAQGNLEHKDTVNSVKNAAQHSQEQPDMGDYSPPQVSTVAKILTTQSAPTVVVNSGKEKVERPRMLVYKLVPVLEEDASQLLGSSLVPLSGYFVPGSSGGDRILLPEKFHQSEAISQSMSVSLLKSVVAHPSHQSLPYRNSPQTSVAYTTQPMQAQTLPPPYHHHSSSNSIPSSCVPSEHQQYASRPPPVSPVLRTALQAPRRQPETRGPPLAPSSPSVHRPNPHQPPQQQYNQQHHGQPHQQQWSSDVHHPSHTHLPSHLLSDQSAPDSKQQMKQTAPPHPMQTRPQQAPQYHHQVPSHQHHHQERSPGQPYTPSWNPAPHHPSSGAPSSQMQRPTQTQSSSSSSSSAPFVSPPQQTQHYQSQGQQHQLLLHQHQPTQVHPTHQHRVLQSPPLQQHQAPQAPQQQRQPHLQHQAPWASPKYQQMVDDQMWRSPPPPTSANMRDTEQFLAGKSAPMVSDGTAQFQQTGLRGVESMDVGSMSAAVQQSGKAQQQQHDPGLCGVQPASNRLQQQEEAADLVDPREDQFIQSFLRSTADAGPEGPEFKQDMAYLESRLGRLSPTLLMSAMAGAYDDDETAGDCDMSSMLQPPPPPTSSTQDSVGLRRAAANNNNNSLQDTINLVHTVNLDLEEGVVPGVNLDLDLGRPSSSATGGGVNSPRPTRGGLVDSPLLSLGKTEGSLEGSLPLDDSLLNQVSALSEQQLNDLEREMDSEDKALDESELGEEGKARPRDRKHQYEIVMENGQRKFRCHLCCRNFTSGTIYRHLRTHDPDYRVHCTVCDKSYTQRSSLVQHMIKCHGYEHIPRQYNMKNPDKDGDKITPSKKEAEDKTPTETPVKSDRKRHSSGGGKSSTERGRQGQSAADGKVRQRRASSHSPSNPLSPGLDAAELVIYNKTKKLIEQHRRYKAQEKRRKAGKSPLPEEEMAEEKSGCDDAGDVVKAKAGDQNQGSVGSGTSKGTGGSFIAVSDEGLSGNGQNKTGSSAVSATPAVGNSEVHSGLKTVEQTPGINLSAVLPSGENKKSMQQSPNQVQDSRKATTSSVKLDELISAVASGEAGDPSALVLDESMVAVGVEEGREEAPSGLKLPQTSTNPALSLDKSKLSQTSSTNPVLSLDKSKLPQTSSTNPVLSLDKSKVEPMPDVDKEMFVPLVKTNEDGKQSFTCRLCSRELKSKTSFGLHIRRHRDAKEKVCSFCGKAFHTSHELKAHMRSHTKEQTNECDICHFSFTHHGTLVQHKKSHAARGETEPFPVVDGVIQYPPSFKKPKSSADIARKKLQKTLSTESAGEGGEVGNQQQSFRRSSLDVNFDRQHRLGPEPDISNRRLSLNDDALTGRDRGNYDGQSLGGEAGGNSNYHLYDTPPQVDQSPSGQQASFISTSTVDGNQQDYYSLQQKYYPDTVGPDGYFPPHNQGQQQGYDYQTSSSVYTQQMPSQGYHQQQPQPTVGFKPHPGPKGSNTEGSKLGNKSDTSPGDIVNTLLQHYNLPEMPGGAGGTPRLEPHQRQNFTTIKEGPSLTAPPSAKRLKTSVNYQQGYADALATLNSYQDPSGPPYSGSSSPSSQKPYNSPQHQILRQPPQYPGSVADRSAQFMAHQQQQKMAQQSPQHQNQAASPQVLNHNSPMHQFPNQPSPQILNQQSPLHQYSNQASPQVLNQQSPIHPFPNQPSPQILNHQSPLHPFPNQPSPQLLNHQSPQHHNMLNQQSPQHHNMLSHQSPQHPHQSPQHAPPSQQSHLVYHQRMQQQQQLPPFAGSPHHPHGYGPIGSPSLSSSSTSASNVNHPQQLQQAQKHQPLPQISSLTRDTSRSLPKSE